MWQGGQDINNETGEAILLLEPKPNPITTYNDVNNSDEEQLNNPTSSFVGGLPIYYPNDENYSLLSSSSSSQHQKENNVDVVKDNQTARLTICNNCNDEMYLLLQMYAPLDGFDRTLYVFACNKASCIQKALSSPNKEEMNVAGANGYRFSVGGMGVVKCLRSQCCRIENYSNKEFNDKIKPQNDKVDETSAWDEVDDRWGDYHDDGEWGDASGWGADDEADLQNHDSTIPSMGDLEAMLAAMEANEASLDQKQGRTSSNKTIDKKKPPKQKNEIAVGEISHDGIPSFMSDSIPSFQKYELEIYDEPTRGGKNNEAFVDPDEDGDDAIGLTNRDDSAVQKMISRYLKEEEDDGVKAMIQKGSSNSSANNGSNTNGEKDERLSPEDRAFLTFTDRIRRAPFQGVRYAYDGIPLWSIPTPLTARVKKKGGRCRDNKFPNIPNCKCGSTRNFEFQLMPSLLYLLDVDKYYKQDSSLEKVLNKDEGGMNWGVIAVYSCSNSCKQSAEEFIVIQESVDANPQKIVVAIPPDDANKDDDSMDD